MQDSADQILRDRVVVAVHKGERDRGHTVKVCREVIEELQTAQSALRRDRTVVVEQRLEWALERLAKLEAMMASGGVAL